MVAVSVDGRSVDVVSATGDVSHFFAAPGGQLSWDGCVSDDGSDGSCADIPGSGSPLSDADSIALSADGNSAYVGADGSNAITAFSVATHGQLTYQTCVSDAGGDGCADAPGSPIGRPESIALSNHGLSLYVASSVSGSVAHFTRATASGTSSGSGATAPVLSSLAVRPSAFTAAVAVLPLSSRRPRALGQPSPTSSAR